MSEFNLQQVAGQMPAIEKWLSGLNKQHGKGGDIVKSSIKVGSKQAMGHIIVKRKVGDTSTYKKVEFFVSRKGEVMAKINNQRHELKLEVQ